MENFRKIFEKIKNLPLELRYDTYLDYIKRDDKDLFLRFSTIKNKERIEFSKEKCLHIITEIFLEDLISKEQILLKKEIK